MLGADSLGLALEADGEGSLSVLTAPPVNGVVVTGGDRGAIGGSGVLGVPIAEGGSEGEGVGVVDGVGEVPVWAIAG